MPSASWLRATDLPQDSQGRRYIDPPNLDQILDQYLNWRGDVNGGGHTLSNVTLAGTGGFERMPSPAVVAPIAADGSSELQLSDWVAGDPVTYPPRWKLVKAALPTADFSIERYNASGALIDAPLSIRMADGIVVLKAQQWTGPVNAEGQTISNVTIGSGSSVPWDSIVGEPATYPPGPHTHAAADTTSGVFATARLGTGTGSTSNFLRGDGAWVVIPPQTPWTQSMDANKFALNNARGIYTENIATGPAYSSAGLLIYEALSGGAQTANESPRIAFYHQGRDAAQIGFDIGVGNGAIRTWDAAGSGHADFAARMGTFAGTTTPNYGGAAVQVRESFRESGVNDLNHAPRVAFRWEGIGACQIGAELGGQIVRTFTALGDAYANFNAAMGDFCSPAVGASQPAVVLRPPLRDFATPVTAAKTPKLMFHWSGVGASQIGMDPADANAIRTYNGAGDLYALFSAHGLHTAYQIGINYDVTGKRMLAGPAALIRIDSASTGNIFMALYPNGAAGSAVSDPSFPLNFQPGVRMGIGAWNLPKTQVDSPYFYVGRIVQEGNTFHAWNLTDEGGQWKHLAAGYGNILSSSTSDGHLRIYTSQNGAAGAFASLKETALFGPSTIRFSSAAVFLSGHDSASNAWTVFSLWDNVYSHRFGAGMTPNASRYFIARFNDSGTWIDDPISIDRATGLVTITTLNKASLGTGTPDSTKYLRGDGVWAIPPGGAGGGQTPWASDIDAARYALNNVFSIGILNSNSNTLTLDTTSGHNVTSYKILGATKWTVGVNQTSGDFSINHAGTTMPFNLRYADKRLWLEQCLMFNNAEGARIQFWDGSPGFTLGVESGAFYRTINANCVHRWYGPGVVPNGTDFAMQLEPGALRLRTNGGVSVRVNTYYGGNAYMDTSGTWRYVENGTAALFGASSNYPGIWYAPVGAAGATVPWVERLRLYSGHQELQWPLGIHGGGNGDLGSGTPSGLWLAHDGTNSWIKSIHSMNGWKGIEIMGSNIGFSPQGGAVYCNGGLVISGPVQINNNLTVYTSGITNMSWLTQLLPTSQYDPSYFVNTGSACYFFFDPATKKIGIRYHEQSVAYRTYWLKEGNQGGFIYSDLNPSMISFSSAETNVLKTIKATIPITEAGTYRVCLTISSASSGRAVQIYAGATNAAMTGPAGTPDVMPSMILSAASVGTTAGAYSSILDLTVVFDGTNYTVNGSYKYSTYGGAPQTTTCTQAVFVKRNTPGISLSMKSPNGDLSNIYITELIVT